MLSAMAIDLKGLLEERLRDGAGLWAKDLAAHREEEFASASGGARSVADFAYETVFVNQRIAARLRGEGVAPMDGFPSCPDDLRSREALAKAMAESAEEVLAAVGDPERTITRPDGTTVSAFASAEFAAIHMYYHLGQVNYIQTVYGDPAVHWM